MPSIPSFTEAHFENLRSSYSATGNPIYAWEAIDWCRNGANPPCPLPDWCVDYLAEAAKKVSALMATEPQVTTIDGVVVTTFGSIGSGPGATPHTPNESEMLGALGFTGKGWNAFKNAGSELRACRAAVRFHQARKIGRSSSEALDEVMAWLGEDDAKADETNAKRLIRKGKCLLGAKPRRRFRS